MKGTAVLLLAVALCVAYVQAQDKKTDVISALNNNGHKLAAAVIEIAGVTKGASDPKARYTFLLPTDAAIESFLKDMGLTVDDLKKRPMLAKHLVGQHTLLGSNVRESEIFAKGESRKAATMAARNGKDDVEFKRTGPGKFTVTDPQGNVANVVGKAIHPDENKTIIPIDRVLMGHNYYTNVDAVCKHRRGEVGKAAAFCDAVKTAGLEDALKGAELTLFVPNDDAFKAATKNGAPSKEALANILKYHIVSGVRALPAGWKEGDSVKTLEGKDLKVTYKRISAKGTPLKYDWAEASVNGAPVIKPNVFVGKSVAHGIDQVLVPGATKVSTEKAAAAPAATATATKSGNRRLLGWGWMADAGPTAVQDATAGAIEAAVSGDESAARAANSADLATQQLSVRGSYANQLVNNW